MQITRMLKLFGKKEVRVGDMGPLYPQVRAAMLDVQAYARSHGGEIVLLGVSEEGDVSIKLTGACHGCPMSGLTLKHGIEEQLKILVPGVRKVVQVN
jgi:Fe-S cluster biogenesis protein NfuA